MMDLIIFCLRICPSSYDAILEVSRNANKAIVLPLSKARVFDEGGNYRPISLLRSFGKVLVNLKTYDIFWLNIPNESRSGFRQRNAFVNFDM